MGSVPRNVSLLSMLKFAPLASMVVGLFAALPPVHAQTAKWPDKPVRIIIPSGPGGVDDFFTRLIAPKLTELLGQQFLSENRPGAGGLIGCLAHIAPWGDSD